MNCFEQLLTFIEELQIIDTHEHLPAEGRRSQSADVLEEWLTHYFACDLVSAGLSDGGLAFARDSSKDLFQRWDAIEPYWQAARSTGYGRALDLAAKGIYGIDGVCRTTLGALNEAFVASRKAGGHYHRVLKDRSRIALSVVDSLADSGLECDRSLFAAVVRLDDFVSPGLWQRQAMQSRGQRFGIRVHRLEDWEEVMTRQLEQFLQQGAVAIKVGLAYQRPLYFARAEHAVAEAQFNRVFSEAHSPPWRPGACPGRELQDYMMHAVLRAADQRGLTVQIHTGLQEGNGNVITDSNPTLLTNLLLEYGNIRFDLFHMGYPYIMELGNLAKNFRNVFIDMCWGHIISPEAARRALVEWLDAVPANKISAFGGDYCFVDGVYGHQYLARRNVAASLAQKVADGSFDLDRARQIARWVFVDNPMRLLNLADRVKLPESASLRHVAGLGR